MWYFLSQIPRHGPMGVATEIISGKYMVRQEVLEGDILIEED